MIANPGARAQTQDDVADEAARGREIDILKRCVRRRCSRAIHSASTSKPKRSSKCSAACSVDPRCCSKACAIAERCKTWSFSIVGWVSINLLVVGGAPQILVGQRRTGRRLVERESVLLVLENVLDGAKAIGAQVFGALAGRVQTIGAMLAPEAHQPETGPVALLGVRPSVEDARDQATGGGPRLFRPGDQARR